MDQNTYIEQAAAHFRTLLTEQLNRQERMAQGSPAKDFSRMECIVIGLIPGDGIGPILMAQASAAGDHLFNLQSHSFNFSAYSAITDIPFFQNSLSSMSQPAAAATSLASKRPVMDSTSL